MRAKAIARAAAFLLILALAARACADESLGALSPRELFVGEKAVFSYIEENIPLNELFAPLEPGAPAVKAFDVPRELIPPDSADIAIEGARLIPLQGRENAALCEITFVPWKTGELFIPEIAFTSSGALRSKRIKVEVASLAARYEAYALMPNRPPILPPGTLYLLYALVLVVAAACFAACLAARKLIELRRGPRRVPAKKIRREFKRLIKAQKRRIGDGKSAWYAEFSSIARLFFYKMTGKRKCLAATARDMARLLERALSAGSNEEAAAAKRLAALLVQIEQIRFSGEECAKGSGQEQRRKSNYIEAFEEFVSLACANPGSFFGAAEDEKPPLAKNVALSKKEMRRVVL